MISYGNSELFKKDETKKQLVITYDGGEIRNDKIYFEQFELIEKLCSAENLMFGKCESSELKFKIANEVGSLKDKQLNVSMILNGLSGNPFQVGKYKVYSDTVSGNKNYRNIVAYDDMYYILNKDVTSWYNSLTFPLTVKQIRNSFFSYVGVAEESQTLVNDSVSIEKTIEATELKGKDILPYICEINGVFGRINRDGMFRYVSLSSSVNETITRSNYSSASYDDFKTSTITGLQIRQEEEDVGVSVGTDTNKYVIQGNFLCYGKEIDELTTIAQNIFNKIKNVQYVPFKITKTGNPCMEVGDMVSVEVKDKSIQSYVLERKLYGIQMLKDDYQANGMIDYSVSDASLDSEIKQLKGKANILTRSIEQTKSEIIDLEENTSTTILQESGLINASLKSLEDNIKASEETMAEELESIRKELSLKATSEELKFEFEKERETGADSVTTSTGYTFNEDGLLVEKSGSATSTMITEDGMIVSKEDGAVLKATSDGVDAVNLHAKTYLIVGVTSRFEDYYNEDGELRTGCFWIGDNVIEEEEATLIRISAVYSGGDVRAGTDLNKLTGLVVTATYSDGSRKTVTDYVLSGTIEAGENVITVIYGGKTTTFTITGYAELQITKQPKNVMALVGGDAVFTIEATGSSVSYQWYYSDDGGNSWKTTVTGDSMKQPTYTIKAVDSSLNGRLVKCVVTDASGNTVTSNIVELIISVSLSSISATYTGGDVAVGTTLTALKGITVIAHYSDGSTSNVTGYTLSGTIAEGSNTITVKYQGKTTTFTVTGSSSAGKVLTGIGVTYYGGNVPVGTKPSELTGIYVMAQYSDGTSERVYDYTLTLIGGFNGSIIEGTNYLRVTYGGFTKEFTVKGVTS